MADYLGPPDATCAFVKTDGTRHRGHTNRECRVQRAKNQREAVVKSITARGGRPQPAGLEGWKLVTNSLPAQYYGAGTPTAAAKVTTPNGETFKAAQTFKQTNLIRDPATGKVIAKEVVAHGGADGAKVIEYIKYAEPTPIVDEDGEKKKPAVVPPHVRAAMEKAKSQATEKA